MAIMDLSDAAWPTKVAVIPSRLRLAQRLLFVLAVSVLTWRLLTYIRNSDSASATTSIDRQPRLTGSIAWRTQQSGLAQQVTSR